MQRRRASPTFPRQPVYAVRRYPPPGGAVQRLGPCPLAHLSMLSAVPATRWSSAATWPLSPRSPLHALRCSRHQVEQCSDLPLLSSLTSPCWPLPIARWSSAATCFFSPRSPLHPGRSPLPGGAVQRLARAVAHPELQHDTQGDGGLERRRPPLVGGRLGAVGTFNDWLLPGVWVCRGVAAKYPFGFARCSMQPEHAFFSGSSHVLLRFFFGLLW
eukprot:365976-Chlamydomonas_euryale.AAC.9